MNLVDCVPEGGKMETGYECDTENDRKVLAEDQAKFLSVTANNTKNIEALTCGFFAPHYAYLLE